MQSDPAEAPALPDDHPGATLGRRFSPWVFFGFLFGPGLLTLVSIFVLPADAGMATAMIMALAGSLVGGIVCGIHFARCQSRLTTGGKIGVGIAMALGCGAVAFAISFGGCLLGAGISSNFQ